MSNPTRNGAVKKAMRILGVPRIVAERYVDGKLREIQRQLDQAKSAKAQ